MRLLLIATACISLAACNLPRGGAVQSEIVTEANSKAPDIALYSVTRDTLANYASWPKTGTDRARGWLRHRHSGPENAISPHDTLDLVIWDSEDQSLLSGDGNRGTQMKDLKVSPAGTVFLPFAGNVHVAGLSESSARTRIQRKMSEAVPSAQVQLTVERGVQGTVSLISGVSRPGPFPINTPHFTVLNALAAAGGPNQKINNPQLRLMRGGKVYTKSLEAVLEEPDLDTVIRGGDKLVVEADKRYFRSLGAASRESIFHFTKEEITALDAMSMIGGLSDSRADPKGILVLRDYPATAVRADDSGPSNDRAVFLFDLTSSDGLFSAGEFQIYDKDTILVTESKIATANVALAILARVLGIASDVHSLNN